MARVGCGCLGANIILSCRDVLGTDHSTQQSGLFLCSSRPIETKRQDRLPADWTRQWNLRKGGCPLIVERPIVGSVGMDGYTVG